MGWIILAVIAIIMISVIGGIVWYWYTIISAQWQVAKAQRDLAARIKRGEVRPQDVPPIVGGTDL